MRKPVVLVTGANGEIGHALIARLAARGSHPVVALDLNPLDRVLAPRVVREFTGSTLDLATSSNGFSPSSRWTWCSTWRRCCRPAPSSRR